MAGNGVLFAAFLMELHPAAAPLDALHGVAMGFDCPTSGYTADRGWKTRWIASLSSQAQFPNVA